MWAAFSLLPIDPTNLTLIGMPGCGKSTVGRALAARLGWAFLDVDAQIEREAGMKLWQINEREGHAGLARREEAANCALACERTVIAPGGSVVYSEPAMRHLRTLGPVIYLRLDLPVLERNAGDLRLRGVVIRPGMTYADLLAERDPLYQQWATQTLECGENGPEPVAALLERRIAGKMTRRPA